MAGVAVPNVRGSERVRGSSWGRSAKRGRGVGGKSASRTVRTAASPPAPPAEPLTFHLQEKLPSRRRRRRSFPRLGEPRAAAGLRGRTVGLSVPEPRPPSLSEAAF